MGNMNDRKWRIDNPELARLLSYEKHLKRKKSPAYIKMRRKATKRWRAKNLLKHYAHRAVERAVKNGMLIRPKACERCGNDAVYIEAHHTDYSKRLEVKWLCKVCHHLEHDEIFQIHR